MRATDALVDVVFGRVNIGGGQGHEGFDVRGTSHANFEESFHVDVILEHVNGETVCPALRTRISRSFLEQQQVVRRIFVHFLSCSGRSSNSVTDLPERSH